MDSSREDYMLEMEDVFENSKYNAREKKEWNLVKIGRDKIGVIEGLRQARCFIGYSCYRRLSISGFQVPIPNQKSSKLQDTPLYSPL
jgi:hypothetical protein